MRAIRALTGVKYLGFYRRLLMTVEFDSGQTLLIESNSQFPLWLPCTINGNECYSVAVSEWISEVLQCSRLDIGSVGLEGRRDFEVLLIEELDAMSR
jgi:hypothetical protein